MSELDSRPRSGMSLIEVLIAIVVMSTAAIMYGSAWSTHAGITDVGREIEIGTELYVRQVERLRMKSARDGFGNTRPRAPFFEAAFQEFNACPPRFDGLTELGTTYYRTRSGANQLSYNTPIDQLLDETNSFLIPVGVPADAAPTFDQAWVPAPPPDLASQGFAVEVYASRVQETTANGLPLPPATLNARTDSNLQQLIKYRILVRRNGRHVMSSEILQEVR